MTVNFTNGRVEKFKCKNKKPTFLYDSGIKGLGIRATPGAKVYIFQRRLDNKVIRIKIGDVANTILEDAKTEATRLQALLNQGIDPRLEKLKTIEKQNLKHQENKRKKIKLSKIWPLYIKARKPKWSQRHFQDHIRMAHAGGVQVKRGNGKTIPGALAPLMDCNLSELTPDRIKTWLQEENAKRSTQARIAFDALRAFINWAEDKKEYKGLASLDACSRRIKKEILPAKKAKEDCLQREQLTVWFEAVKRLNNPIISAYLQGLLLTGARREELAWLKWGDLDFKWKAMTLHDKVDGLRTIPLTPYLSYLFNSLPRCNQWVFSSPQAASGRLQEPRIAHNQALSLAEIPNLTIHGLRRSFGTLSEWIEVPAGVTAQLMGHKPSATAEKHYRKRPLDLLRMWHEKIEKWILDQATIEQPTTSQPGLKIIGG